VKTLLRSKNTIASLDKAKLDKIKKVEQELGIILIAYNK
jgi:hypothetical protein